MSKGICMDGVISDVLPNLQFKVDIEVGGSKKTVTAHLAGKMRRSFIKVMAGDKVTVELSEYDLSRGRIVYRKQ